MEKKVRINEIMLYIGFLLKTTNNALTTAHVDTK